MKQFGFRIADSDSRIDQPAAPPAGDTVDLSRLLSAARRQRKVVFIAMGISLCLGLVYLATTPKTYVAGSTVLLAGKMNRSIDEVSALDTNAVSDNALESAQQVIKSQAVALSVAKMLELETNESFLEPPTSLLAQVLGTTRAALRAPIQLLTPSPPESEAGAPPTVDEITARKQELVAQVLQAQIDVQRIGRSSVFGISYASHDPALAAAITNAYSEAYVADLLNANYEATERTTEWLQQRLEELQAASREAAVAAEIFRAENGLVSSRGALITEENVAQLNGDLADAVTETARAGALMRTYEAILARGAEAFLDDSTSFSLQGNERLIEMQDQLSALNSRLERIERDFGADHPQAVRLREQVTEQSNLLFSELRRLLEEARGAFEVAQAQVNALRDSLGLAVDVNSEAGQKQVQLKSLEQRADTLTTLYQTFLTRFQEIDQQKTFPISNVRILSVADVPINPSAPGTSSVLALMLVLGALAGAGVGVLREWRDRFLRTTEDVQLDAGQRFLGYLPTFESATSAPQVTRQSRASALKLTAPVPGMPVIRQPIYALQNMRSHYAETLRNIRFASEVSLAGKSQIVIGVTSIRPAEGKSSVALNLAGVMAASGHSVLLIDTDPRNPGLSRRLGLSRGVGLVEAALGKSDWTKALRVISDTGVHVLPCITPGSMTHSSELLGSKGMRQLLAAARARYSHVILDLAPLGPVVDARVALPLVDQIIMVAEWGKTPKALMRETLMNEPALQEKMLGVVLNKVDMDALREYAPVSSGEQFYEEYGDYISGRT